MKKIKVHNVYLWEIHDNETVENALRRFNNDAKKESVIVYDESGKELLRKGY